MRNVSGKHRLDEKDEHELKLMPARNLTDDMDKAIQSDLAGHEASSMRKAGVVQRSETRAGLGWATGGCRAAGSLGGGVRRLLAAKVYHNLNRRPSPTHLKNILRTMKWNRESNPFFWTTILR